MAQVYPEDRGTNYAIRMGREVARLVASKIGNPVSPVTYGRDALLPRDLHAGSRTPEIPHAGSRTLRWSWFVGQSEGGYKVYSG